MNFLLFEARWLCVVARHRAEEKQESYLSDDFQTIWTRIDHIALGITQAMFDAQLRGLRAVALEDETLAIEARNERNKAWLESERLRPVIERGVRAAFGRELSVEFRVRSSEFGVPGSEADAPQRAAPNPKSAIQNLKSDLARLDHATAGWSQQPHYLTRFWRAYIGAVALDLWEFVRSHCKNGKLTWSPARDFTGRELARGTACSYQRMVGVWRTCAAFDRALLEDGEILGRCCGKHTPEAGPWPGETRATDLFPQGRPACRYWVPGALEILEAEGLAVWEKRGDSPRSTFYTIQVYQHPPLLTPLQAERLDSVMQIEHRDFLRGLLASKGFSLADWERYEADFSFLPYLNTGDGLTLPLPEVGVYCAAARNTIFFACDCVQMDRNG